MDPLSQDELVLLANNPERGVTRVVNEIEVNWYNGTVRLNSKSHPAVLAIDLILGTTHGFLMRLEDATSKVFMKHARTDSDLSRNIADDERFGLFANPSECTLQFAINEVTFKQIAKDYTVVQGNTTLTYKKLLIPKDSYFDIGGYSFVNNNGIEIRYSERSGWQAVYDEETNNRFSPIETNLIEKDVAIVGGNVYRLFNIPVQQLAIASNENITSNESTGCRGTLTYTDYLYGVRAFLVQNGVLSEIGVTYDQDVFNPLTVTLAMDLDTVNKKYNYEIPDVYIENGLGIGSLRIYTYTTKGALVKDFTTTPSKEIGVVYQDLRYGSGKLNEFSAPLRNTSDVAWAVLDKTTGGSDPVSFVDRKQALIAGRRSRNTPITESNLVGKVQTLGYDAVKTIDFVTARTYTTTKELPLQTNKPFYAPMSCYVGSYLTSANNLVNTGVVFDNGKRITIPHDVLFDITQPTSELVTQSQKNRYNSMSSDDLIDTMSNLTLCYTPFYYVMDTTSDQAVLRTYHLDEPFVSNQKFIYEQTSLGFELGVGSISIDHQEDGYLITIVTKSGDSYRKLDNNQVGMQLSVSPQDTTSLASIAGTLVGVTDAKERIWEFKLTSTFDVDVNDILYFNNLVQFGSTQVSTGLPLSLTMTFIFCLVGDQAATRSDSDLKIDPSLFPNEMVAIIETSYGVTFGSLMGNLYSRIRPLIGVAQYQVYPADVPETYAANVYKRDDKGFMVFDDSGAAILLEKAGDIIYNPDGTERLLYRGGVDIIYENGVPLELAPRDLKYHWDFVAFDANYYFSTDPYDVDFAQETKDFFVNVISKDLAAFSAQTLDRSKLFYQPRSKLGYANVIVNSNREVVLKQDLEFVIVFYLTMSGYRNQNLKDTLTENSPKVINMALLGATTIAINSFVQSLMQDAGDQVVGVKLEASAGDDTVDVISNYDGLAGFSVRKLLELRGEGGVGVKESIDIVFQPHDISAVSVT